MQVTRWSSALVLLLASTACGHANMFKLCFTEDHRNDPDVTYAKVAPNAGEVTLTRGKDYELDGNAMLEDGYVFLGASTFTDEHIAWDRQEHDATAFAKTLGASKVLLYSYAADPSVHAYTSQSQHVDMSNITWENSTGPARTVDTGDGQEHVVEDVQSTPHFKMVTEEQTYTVEHEQRTWRASFWAKATVDPLGVRYWDIPAEQRAALGSGDAKVKVYAVVHGSPAAAAGLAHQDVLVSIAGEPIVDSASLHAQIKRLAGKRVPLELVRNGKRLTVGVALRAAPQ